MKSSGNDKPDKAPWADLFENRRVYNDTKLGFNLEKTLCEGGVCELDEADEIDTDGIFGYCLLGFFAGRFPGKPAMKELCNKWNVEYQFMNHASGWIIFKFSCDEDRVKVLHGGPYREGCLS